MSTENWAIALHGGAGTIARAGMAPERRAEYEASLAACLAVGSDILSNGGNSMDAVEATVNALEDAPLFNAGRGAVLTSDGTFELDSAIMRGRDLAAGAVINVRRIANPISLARLVMEHSNHVVLAGDGAERFAGEQGVAFVEPAYFETEHRRAQLVAARGRAQVMLDHSEDDDPATRSLGTVGAVARDAAGDLAAATSTGGMTNKHPGRVGDSPLIGAGTYASNLSCAVSATGHGEMFIRLVVAHDIAALMQHGGLTLEAAVRRKVCDELPAIDGSGGVVAVGRSGPPVMMFNTPGMYRARQCAGGAPEIAIFAD